MAITLPVQTNSKAQSRKEIESTEVMLLIMVKPKYVNTKASAIFAIILETTDVHGAILPYDSSKLKPQRQIYLGTSIFFGVVASILEVASAATFSLLSSS